MEDSDKIIIAIIIALELVVFVDVAITWSIIAAFVVSFILTFILTIFSAILYGTNTDRVFPDSVAVPTFVGGLLVTKLLIILVCGGFWLMNIMINEATLDSRIFGVLLMLGIPLAVVYGIFREIIPYIYAYIKGVDGKYAEFVEDNKVSLGLFTRPTFLKYKIVLANKYFILEFDTAAFSLGAGKLTITDKIDGYEYKIAFRRGYGKRNKTRKFEVFEHLCREINYDSTADDLVTIAKFYNGSVKTNTRKMNYIDINQCSEAELTAIPGVTIAKAKHAVKMRKKYAFYISMKQFYETVGLEEEFIEQIQTHGNKIILNTLPEYKRLNGQIEV